MPNNARIELVVLKQHDVELQNYIQSTTANEIAASLESLSLDDAKWVWARIPADRQNEILWELSNKTRE